MVYKPTGVLNERKTDTGRNTWTTADNSDATSQQCWFCKFSALQTDKLAGVLYRVSVCRTFGGASAQPGCLYKVTDCQPAAPCDGWSRVAPPPGGVSSRFWLVSGSLAASSACWSAYRSHYCLWHCYLIIHSSEAVNSGSDSSHCVPSSLICSVKPLERKVVSLSSNLPNNDTGANSV